MSDERFVNLLEHECPVCQALWGEHDPWQQGYCQGKASAIRERNETQDALLIAERIITNAMKTMEHPELLPLLWHHARAQLIAEGMMRP